MGFFTLVTPLGLLRFALTVGYSVCGSYGYEKMNAIEAEFSQQLSVCHADWNNYFGLIFTLRLHTQASCGAGENVCWMDIYYMGLCSVNH